MRNGVHICSPDGEIIHDETLIREPKSSSLRKTLIRCTVCGKYHMLYADVLDEVGGAHFALAVGQSYGRTTFSQAELSRVLAEVT